MPALKLPSLSRGRSRTVVGLDLGEGAFKAVEVQRTAAGIEVVNAALAPVPPGLREGAEGATPEKLGDWIAGVLKTAGIRASRAVWAVPRQRVILRWLALPAATPEELGQMVRFQAGKDLPLPLEQVRFNYVTLGEEESPAVAPAGPPPAGGGAKPAPLPSADARSRRTRVLLAALPSPAAERLDAVTDAAGLELAGATPSGPATWSAAVAAGAVPAEGGAAAAVLDIGWATTEVLVGAGGRLRFSRSASIGLAGLSSALGRGDDVGAVDRLGLDLPPAAAAWTQKFLAEIGRSLRAQQAEAGGAAVERIVVAGGGAAVPALVKALAAATGLPVAPLDLFGGAAIAAGRELAVRDAALAAAAGAALGAARDDAGFLNLLGALTVRRRLVLGRVQRLGLVAAAAVIVGIGVLHYAVAGKERRLADRRAGLARLKDKADRVRALEARIALAAQWGDARTPVADLLRELTVLRPGEAYVSTLVIEESGAVRINGRSASNQVVSRFVSALNGSTLLHGAQMSSCTRNTDRGAYKYDFAITARVRSVPDPKDAKPAPGKSAKAGEAGGRGI